MQGVGRAVVEAEVVGAVQGDGVAIHVQELQPHALSSVIQCELMHRLSCDCSCSSLTRQDKPRQDKTRQGKTSEETPGLLCSHSVITTYTFKATVKQGNTAIVNIKTNLSVYPNMQIQR